MIKVFKVSSMSRTPFEQPEDLQLLAAHGIIMVDKITDCDVLVSCQMKFFSDELLLSEKEKKFLIWTHEPRLDKNFSSILKKSPVLPEVHFMNAYTGDIYFNNYFYFGGRCAQTFPVKPLGREDLPELKNRKMVALMGYKESQKTKLIRGSKDIDLSALRISIALEGYSQGIVDICGEGWPKEINVLESSRRGNWHKRKRTILDDYHFNLCFENTNIDYYCTEKIWDSITSRCLPVYYGHGNKIYEDFPRDSFLDYSEFGSPKELFDYVQAMPVEEFRKRMNLCIEVANQIKKLRSYETVREKAILRIVDKLKGWGIQSGSQDVQNTKSIKVFKAFPMPHTPFERPKDVLFLTALGVRMSQKVGDCDVVVVQTLRSLFFLKEFLFSARNKRFLVWTHEPRFNTTFSSIKKFFFFPAIHIMNTYTGDVYFNNYHHAYDLHKLFPMQLLTKENFNQFKTRKIAALMSYQAPQMTKLMNGAINMDLAVLRNSIALEGYAQGKVDIYGNGWPKNVMVVENSRAGKWHVRKMEILKKYHFNLCFENTNSDYYCTEKIWDSIGSGCLPIYYGKGNKIYEDFPKGSFIDYAEFQSPQELFDYIETMPAEEFRKRMNLCIDVGNQLRQKMVYEMTREKIFTNIVNKLREVTNYEF
jgi:hypothetical protein